MTAAACPVCSLDNLLAHHEIDCKIEGSAMALKAMFVKKA
jgi:uncharacterized Zn ribbon protein